MSENKKAGLVDHPAHLLRMGRSLVKSGSIAQASALARKAREERPADAMVSAVSRAIMAHRIPRFHQSMLQDHVRNQAYRIAIEAEAEGRTILDIGTGSGLLAMMAARAGAKHVYACEADDRLAQTAREIVERNGMADRVTVIPGHSSKLDAHANLGGGVDLVISEIFGNDLLAEGVLPSLRDARERLCLPGATFLPAKASIRVALVECLPPKSERHSASIDDVEGFDLSLFSRHLPIRMSLDADSPRLQLRSSSADLFEFGFDQAIAKEARRSATVTATGGTATHIAQWIGFASNSGHRYENDPKPEGVSHWAVNCHALETPIATTENSEIAIDGWHDDEGMICWI